ncbi:hypothetical protein GGS23DRAFT_561350 [Durotheca rogersii]|uniref:uncharacterized protein n=1 Tax=Durotheca rogersii TaxID=419775 RepID=UPI00221F8B5F|nr:uncharacterized protein GGS23DRAFT_561350 [Durotheca rogersii]KAI5864675.1 hypothetical protein GGS23DRAFT_561350 [Durotheca rogersii]
MSSWPAVAPNEYRPPRDDEPASTKVSSDLAKLSSTATPTLASQHRRVIIPDPIAFRFLEEDSCVTVVKRRQELKGYELYLVEQWACSRRSPTLVIATYTGDEKHSIVAGVLAVPADDKTWSHRLRIYFRAIQQYHARPKETHLGELMVTNLSSFPSALTVVPVPEGDIQKHRREFVVNEDLKRLGCSGRSGMTLSEPTGAARAKFYQLYKTTDKISFSDAVVELVKMCQKALFLFGNLDKVYIDGLLCDMTETAIGDWWTQFGAEYHNIEPTDGILGPTTVAALLGLLMGARNRLSYLGVSTPKDVFDVEATEKGISSFQKYQKLERTGRLDRQTMHRLRTTTAKAAAGEGWGVQKAVKSTVSEIGGKRGEIVLGMVGGRDKAGIGDIETLDFDRFVSLAYGERAKWLWFGKTRRSVPDSHERAMSDMGNILFGKEDPSHQSKRTQAAPSEDEVDGRQRDDTPGVYSTPAPGSAVSIADSPGERDGVRRGVFKSVARDARSGLGRIKDAVYSGGGLRNHTSRPSKDESSETTISAPQSSVLSDYSAGALLSATPEPGQVGRAFTWKNKPEEYLNAFRKERQMESAPPPVALPASDNSLSRDSRPMSHAVGDARGLVNNDAKRVSYPAEIRNEKATVVESSVADSAVADSVLQGPFVDAEQSFGTLPSGLHRRHSIGAAKFPERGPPNDARWPRRLSFSNAEEAVLRWDNMADVAWDKDTGDLVTAKYSYVAELATSLYANILEVAQTFEPWVARQTKSIEEIDDDYARQQEELETLYYQRSDGYENVLVKSREKIGEQRAHITEALKEVEVQAARLEYEISALVSRVQDVEDGVAQFEMQVDEVERRADELKRQLETESWVHWAVRTLTGIGTGPNITRPRQQ